MIYILCFAISIFFAIIANKYKDSSKKYYFFSIISILFPALLAGLRDVNIGTDVKVYVLPSFNIALASHNLSAFFENMKYYNLDFLFLVLTFFTSHAFENISFVLFCESFITISLFYFGINNICDEKKSRPFIFLLFLLIYYNFSLNIIRQFIALSIIFYSFKYIKEEKNIKFFILLIIATLFHNTAVIGLLMYFLYYISKKKNSLLYSIVIFTMLLGFMFNYNSVLVFLAKYGIVAERYVSRYAIGNSGVNISFADEIIKIYTLLLIILKGKNLKNDKLYSFLRIVSVFDFIIFQIGSFVDYASRISLYFGVFPLILITKIINNANKDKKILYLITLMIYFIYFVYMYLICQNGQTYPYVFAG